MLSTRRWLAGVVALLLLVVLAAAVPSAVQANPTNRWYLSAGKLCVQDHTSTAGIPVRTATQQWNRNAAVTVVHQSDTPSKDCSRSGYTKSSTADVWMSDTADGRCINFRIRDSYSGGRYVLSRAIIYLNRHNPSCWSTPVRKAHYISQAVGYVIGLATVSNGGNGTVMTGSSRDVVSWPTDYDIAGVEGKYPYLHKSTATPAPSPTPTVASTTPSPTDTPAQTPSPTPTATTPSPTTTSPTPTPTQTSSQTTGGPLAIKVVGNHLVNQNGAVVQLRGANRSGTQYACAEGWGFFDGPSDDASIQSMKNWGMNAVRVNGNEDCWLGINGVNAAYSGSNYRAAIGDFVRRINAKGMYVIFDMHHSAPGTQKALGQQSMPDRDHAPDYWASVADYFKNDPAVLFDLYNEPHPDNNSDSTGAWTCVKNGGACPGVSFTAAGMQELVTAVRQTGATNPVLVSGPQYAGTVDRWQEFKPSDPAGQLVASVHVYGQPLGSPYDDPTTWNGDMATLATQVPVVMGEIGDTDCTHKFTDQLMTWADAHGVSYTAWAWVTSSCAGEPALITDYNGTPTAYGVGVRDHLLSLPHPQ